MAKKKNVPIGFDDFRKVREQDMYYVDKTDFIREWLDRGDSVTLIIRPSRFGKTLTMSMVEPKNPAEHDAFILEFKVFNKRKENSLEDTVQIGWYGEG